jgi:hypothetical protein
VFFYGKDQVLLVILEKSTKFWMSKSWEKKNHQVVVGHSNWLWLARERL